MRKSTDKLNLDKYYKFVWLLSIIFLSFFVLMFIVGVFNAYISTIGVLAVIVGGIGSYFDWKKRIDTIRDYKTAIKMALKKEWEVGIPKFYRRIRKPSRNALRGRYYNASKRHSFIDLAKLIVQKANFTTGQWFYLLFLVLYLAFIIVIANIPIIIYLATIFTGRELSDIKPPISLNNLLIGLYVILGIGLLYFILLSIPELKDSYNRKE